MSLRYTGEATMDEPALRDVERWKDKIEVRLDNRQVFFLFFGSAMVACMLFVLGVIVGKRLESRGRAEAPAVEDPLAVLDRFGAVVTPAAPPAALTFPRALIGGGPAKNRPSSPERLERSERADKLERTERADIFEGRSAVGGRGAGAAAERTALEPVHAVASKPTLTATTPVPVAVPSPPLPTVAPKAVVTAPVRVAPSGRAVATTTVAASSPVAAVTPASRKLAALPRPLAAPAPAAQARSVPALIAKEPSSLPKIASAPAAKSAAAAAAPAAEKPKGRFLLQLSSFQQRGEADAFARRFSGQNAYVVATEIPGKGTWYRVRVGSYGSMQEAAAAKTNFERDHNVIAYVAGSGPAK